MKEIKGLVAKRYDQDVHNMLRFDGPKAALDHLRKNLTFTNKSVSYRIRMVQKTISKWTGRTSDFAAETLRNAHTEMDQLKKDLTTEYFIEKDGYLVAPAGYWKYAEKVTDDFHLNTEIVPFSVEGQRPYQVEGLQEMLKYKRATGVFATGLGKTRVIISLALSAIKSGKRVAIIVPTKDLVEQFLKTTKSFHESSTGTHSERKPKLGCDILITTIGSAARHIDPFDVIIIDEGHHAVARTWAELLGSCENCQYTYNFTATPFRSDGLDLGIFAFGGPVVYERDLIWGIKNNWLEHFDVYRMHLSAKIGGMKINVPDGSMQTSAYKKLVSNPHFVDELAKIIRKAHGSGRKIMVLFKTLPPANALAKKLKEDIGCQVANANWKKPLADFQAGKSQVLLATSKLVGEGIDIPDADTLILVTQNSSDGMTYQALGRILRKSEGKKKPIVIDIIVEGFSSFAGSAIKRRTIWRRAADNVIDIKSEN